MKIFLPVQVFCVIVCVAVAGGCTAPASCPLNAPIAILLSVRAPGSVDDVTQTARVDVTRNGVPVARSEIQNTMTGAAKSEPIRVYGNGGNYAITVHHEGYRDTTVTASVMDGECGPVSPPVALIVSLTAL